MKFYGNGIVWNAKANQPLCVFEKGEFVTEDDSVIQTLADLGYKHDPPIIIEVKKEEVKPIIKRPVKRKKAVKK